MLSLGNNADSALDQSERSVLMDMLKCLPTADLAPSLKVFNMGYQNYSQGEWQAHFLELYFFKRFLLLLWRRASVQISNLEFTLVQVAQRLLQRTRDMLGVEDSDLLLSPAFSHFHSFASCFCQQFWFVMRLVLDIELAEWHRSSWNRHLDSATALSSSAGWSQYCLTEIHGANQLRGTQGDHNQPASKRPSMDLSKGTALGNSSPMTMDGW